MDSNSHLVILLHGIGASGAQLMPLASSWRSGLPGARFAAPDAPFHHPRGHEWFAVDGSQLRPDRIQSVREAFDRTVSEIVEREGFGKAHDRIAFVGVSQGAIVGLDAVATGRWQIGALVSFAGLLPPTEISQKSKGTPVLLVHGQADLTIPSMASTMAAGQLKGAGFTVELDLLPGVGHTVSMDGAEKALRFLQKNLA
jgi:phospholipase/carboxylesterase